MGTPKKVYVTSGQLYVCIQADGPMDAIRRSLKHASHKVIDSDFFFIDERGHRVGEDAQYKVPVEQALAEAGYVFDDQDRMGGGDCGVIQTPIPSDWSPSAEE